MIDNIENYVDFLEEYDLTSSQFLFCYLLAIEDYRNIKRHFVDRNNLLKSNELDKLVSNNIINIKNYKKDDKDLKINQITVNGNFSKKIIVNKEVAATEIFEAYFDYGWWGDVKVPARDIILEDFVDMYGKIIKNNRQEHERILKITKAYVKSRPFAEKGLKKYIGTRMYNLVETSSIKNDKPKFGEKRL